MRKCICSIEAPSFRCVGYIAGLHNSPGTNPPDVRSVHWLHRHSVCAILELDQFLRLTQAIEERATRFAGSPDSEDEATFLKGSSLHPWVGRFFVSKGVCSMSTRAESPPATRTHLRPAEVAARTGLSKSAVFHALYTGKLRATRVGRAWLVPIEAVQEWLDGGGQDRAA